jgi:hypothetical protein
MDRGERKEIADQIMRRLSAAYKPETQVYKRVRKALDKLSGQELDSLDCMVLTATGPSDRKDGDC